MGISRSRNHASNRAAAESLAPLTFLSTNPSTSISKACPPKQIVVWTIYLNLTWFIQIYQTHQFPLYTSKLQPSNRKKERQQISCGRRMATKGETMKMASYKGAWLTPPFQTSVYTGSSHRGFMQTTLSNDRASPLAICHPISEK